jgi:hypothetical protein
MNTTEMIAKLQRDLEEAQALNHKLFETGKALQIKANTAFEEGYAKGKEMNIAEWLEETKEFLRLEELIESEALNFEGYPPAK